MQYFRFAITVIFLQIETFTYLIVNWLCSALPSKDLLTPDDEKQPLRPRSLWLYLSLVPYCLLMFFEFRSYRQLLRILTCLMLDSAIAYRCFFRWPSSYPRPPLPQIDDERLARSWRDLHKMDRPGNTFPSLHVSHVYLLALIMARQVPREHAKSYFVWATAISLSTIITKQHYLVDVTGGLMLAETICSEIYEPWEDGRLSFRQAFGKVKEVCEKLDELGENPASYRLQLTERHARVAELLGEYRTHRSFVRLYRSCGGRQFLFDRKTQLLELLRPLRGYMAIANRVMPGLLQFMQDMQEADPMLNDDRLGQYLEELDRDLCTVMEALFEFEPAALEELPEAATTHAAQ